MNWPTKQHPKTVLGLTIDGSRFNAVLLRRTNGHAELQKAVDATLSLDLFNSEAELVGQEIRNQLDAAGVKERRCVVGLPIQWALTLHTKLPAELSEEDAPEFLQLEAERGFPCGLDELQVATVRHTSPSGDRYATQIGVRLEQLARLETVLEAAQLRPASFALGLAALPGALPEARSGIAAFVGESGVELLVASGGGIVALRTLEEAFDAEAGEKRIQGDLVARELRITLGQLPADIVNSLTQLAVYGTTRHASQLADELRPRAKALGLAVEAISNITADQHGMKIAGATGVSPALSLAAQYLSARGNAFEFLPPKPSFWKQMAGRYSSKRLGYAGATAGAVAAILCGMFLYQQIVLSSLRSEWAKMKPKVTELEELQAKVRKYRPWYDDSLTGLSILRRVTEAFPEDGVVTAKMLDIRQLSTVNVSGTTRDQAALLKMLEQLRAAKEVSGVRVNTISGKSPMQFTFNFQWGGGRAE